MEEPENESVCPAGVPALDFPGRRIISVIRQQDVKLPMVMYGYLSDRQCGTMTRQLPGNEQDEFY